MGVSLPSAGNPSESDVRESKPASDKPNKNAALFANMTFNVPVKRIPQEDQDKVHQAFFDIHGCQWLGRLTSEQRKRIQPYIKYCVDRLAEEHKLKR